MASSFCESDFYHYTDGGHKRQLRFSESDSWASEHHANIAQPKRGSTGHPASFVTFSGARTINLFLRFGLAREGQRFDFAAPFRRSAQCIEIFFRNARDIRSPKPR